MNNKDIIKVIRFTAVIILYVIFRMLVRFKTAGYFIEKTDFVFSFILIAVYSLYIYYKKIKKK